VSGEALSFVESAATLVPAAELASRLAALQARLASRDLDAALIVQNADLYYFSGTIQQSHLYVPAAGDATLFVRKVPERARLESALEGIVEVVSLATLPEAIVARYGALPRRVGLELDVLPVQRFRALERLLPEAAFEDVGRDIVQQRAVKSAWEVARIRVAAAVADGVCALIPGILREGLTEVEFAGRVEAEARRLGHEGYIRMRGFNQEMFYGQLLTGPSATAPSQAASRSTERTGEPVIRPV
jgi:Xaa-Pro aminopeptidase